MIEREPVMPDFVGSVIAFDFKLPWAVRDQYPPGDACRGNLLGGRAATPRMLNLLPEFGIASTWATVGFLFTGSRDEFCDFHPTLLHHYANSRLSPDGEPLAVGEMDRSRRRQS